MRNPSLEDELLLHERLVRRDPVASTDVFLTYAERILKVLRRLRFDEDAAHDSTVEALFSYSRHPEWYDPGKKKRLFSYLMQAAKYRALDKRRKADARAGPEKEFVRRVELQKPAPKEVMEDSVEAKLVWRRLVNLKGLKNERDGEALRLILFGERSTERLAEALGVASLPRDELKRAVKRHRDRLMKLLERFGKEDPDDES